MKTLKDEFRLEFINDFLNELYREGLPPLISVSDAACLIGVSRKTAYTMAKKGQLPVVKLPNGRIKINTRKFLEIFEED